MVEDEPGLFCAFELDLSTINLGGFAKVLGLYWSFM